MTIDKLARAIVDDYCDAAPGSERYQAQVELVKKGLAARLIDEGDPICRSVWVPIDTNAEGEPI